MNVSDDRQTDYRPRYGKWLTIGEIVCTITVLPNNGLIMHKHYLSSSKWRSCKWTRKHGTL